MSLYLNKRFNPNSGCLYDDYFRIILRDHRSFSVGGSVVIKAYSERRLFTGLASAALIA